MLASTTPVPGAHRLPPEYHLTAAELRALDVDRCPITVEHSGIREAVAALTMRSEALTPAAVGTALNALDSVHAQPVGAVVSHGEGADGRFYALFAVDDATYPCIPFLIEAGALRGMSLTHRVGTPPLALEISLCTHPARPQCYVLTANRDLEVQATYLRKLITRPPPAMNADTATAAAAPTLEDALKNLPEDQRAIVSANFGDMLALVERMKSQMAQKEEELVLANKAAAAAKAGSEANNKMLEAQVRQMSNLLNENLTNTYFCGPDQLMTELQSGDAAVVRAATDRMICACNRQMMENAMRSQGAPEERTTPAPKRKVEEVAPAEPAAAPPLDDGLRDTDREVLAKLNEVFGV